MALMGLDIDIRDIVLTLLVFIVLYLIIKTKNINIDNFADAPTTDELITNAVSDKYLVDISAMRNLGNIAQSILTDDELILPANVKCPGNLVIDGNITCTNKNTNLMNIFPKYMVIAWANSDYIPKGWAVCDGQSYAMDTDGTVNVVVNQSGSTKTPDLRGKFILGVNSKNNNNQNYSTYELLVEGGEETHLLTIPELPKHSHSHTFYQAGLNHHGHWTEGQIMQNNNGTLNSPTNTTGDDKPHNNMPPYMALIYIMKL